jgi:hypothetical protein
MLTHEAPSEEDGAGACTPLQGTRCDAQSLAASIRVAPVHGTLGGVGEVVGVEVTAVRGEMWGKRGRGASDLN